MNWTKSLEEPPYPGAREWVLMNGVELKGLIYHCVDLGYTWGAFPESIDTPAQTLEEAKKLCEARALEFLPWTIGIR